MNQFLNPLFLIRILKSYLFDINRLKRFDEAKLKKFKDRQFRKMVEYAYSVPMYHDIYKNACIHPNDIQGIKDIKKLPEISKHDIAKYYPYGIVSKRTDKNKLIEVSTSGTTGKSLSLFVDMYDVVAGLFGYLRQFNEYGINWRKHRVTIIGDFAPHTVESGYINRGLNPRLNQNIFFKNIQWLNTNDDPKDVIKEVNHFKPYFLGGYTGMLGHLALLKEKGEGKGISPKIIASTGAPLNKPLLDLIKSTFDVEHVFESYASTESGPIAFQCKNGKYHILSDLVHLEFLKDGNEVESGEAGKVVLTKLYGKGTPIIRYNAINDIVSPLHESCKCGMVGDTLQKIYGRDDLGLYLPNGKVLLPSGFSEIFGQILYGLKTNKIKDTMIIQNDQNKIEIQVLIDEKIYDDKPSNDKIFSIIKNGFEKKVGSDVEVVVKEVKKIERKGARIVSNVNRTDYKIKEYL